MRVGRAQVELEAAAPAGRAGLEGDAQLELARHADAVGRHHREPREQRGVEEPRARAGPALLLAQLVLAHGARAGREHRRPVEPGLGLGRELLLEARLLHDLAVGAAHGVDGRGAHRRPARRAGHARGSGELCRTLPSNIAYS